LAASAAADVRRLPEAVLGFRTSGLAVSAAADTRRQLR
jgi:hypothetical protein